jgi:hypothetical protein
MGFMTSIAPLAGLVGTAVSGIGAISSGKAEAAQANYQAQVAKNDQIIAYQNANYATAAGETKSYNEGLQQRAKAGAITGGIAAGGLDVNSGSAAQIRESQEALGLQDVETVRQQAALTAYGYRTQATNFGAQAQLDTAEAKNDSESGWLNGLGSLIGGLAKYGGGLGGLFPGSDPTSSTALQQEGVISGPANPYFVTS